MSSNSESTKIELKYKDTKIALQLGDVISITNSLDQSLNQVFFIDYIDESKTNLINIKTLENIEIPISKDGIFGDGNIIPTILSKSDSPSYAIQNGLLPNNWIDIYFGGEIPVIITGKITNLENDMIEITDLYGDVLYLNFDYKGLPKNLPIKLIKIRDEPSQLLNKQ